MVYGSVYNVKEVKRVYRKQFIKIILTSKATYHALHEAIDTFCSEFMTYIITYLLGYIHHLYWSER